MWKDSRALSTLPLIKCPIFIRPFKITFPKKLACLVSDRKFTFYTVASRTNFSGGALSNRHSTIMNSSGIKEYLGNGLKWSARHTPLVDKLFDDKVAKRTQKKGWHPLHQLMHLRERKSVKYEILSEELPFMYCLETSSHFRKQCKRNGSA